MVLNSFLGSQNSEMMILELMYPYDLRLELVSTGMGGWPR
jgi:hypothetical protein